MFREILYAPNLNLKGEYRNQKFLLEKGCVYESYQQKTY